MTVDAALALHPAARWVFAAYHIGGCDGCSSASNETLAEVALATGAIGLSPGVVDTELTGLLEEALAGIGPEDSLLRVHLISCLARALYWSHADQPRRSLIDEAVAMARRMNDPEAPKSQASMPAPKPLMVGSHPGGHVHSTRVVSDGIESLMRGWWLSLGP